MFKRIVWLLAICLVIVSSSSIISSSIYPTEAAISTKSVSKYKQYKSWVGINIFRTGVLGHYDTDGKSVKSFGKVHPKHSTGLVWSFNKETANWTSTNNKKQAQAYSQAKFTLGVSTKEASIGIQSTTKGITATKNTSI